MTPGMAGNPGLGAALALMVACGLLAAPHASGPAHTPKARSGGAKAHLGSWRVRPGALRARSASAPPSRFGLEAAASSSQAVQEGREARGRFTVRVTVRNLNDEPVTVFGIGRSGPGLRLLSPRRPVPHPLRPERSTSFDLRYRVTDCGAVPRGNWPIPVRLERNGAPEVAYPSLRMVAATSTNDGTGPGGESWQSVMSDEICGVRRSR